MKIVIGSDERGSALKDTLKELLDSRGIDTEDLGAQAEGDDEGAVSKRVAEHVSNGSADQGILVWSSGRALAYEANRHPDVRATLCCTPHMAKIARSRNDGNLLILGADLLDPDEGIEVLNEWLGSQVKQSPVQTTVLPPVSEPGAPRPAFAKKEILEVNDPAIFEAIQSEQKRQRNTLVLIASENYASSAVNAAQGSVMGNKYAEGYPGKRYYNGCKFVDVAEELAINRAKEIFGVDHVNVQPHCGSTANMAVYGAVLSPGDSILAMSLNHGGHLTHGHPLSFSGKVYNIVPYGVSQESERIDMEQLAALAREHKPRLIVVGASAYSRILDFEAFRAIADENGAMLMADIAHIAGLIATAAHPDPAPFCDFVTTTTHKTLRGPRGGMIMCRQEYAKAIDREVFPGLQGGPAMHTIAAKAVSFGEVLRPEFRSYIQQVIDNARVFSDVLSDGGIRVVSGGTDNHLFMADVTPLGLTGRDASSALEAAGIAVNKNSIPFDPNPPAIGSGIRIGTPAVTTRGMGEDEMRFIAAKFIEVFGSIGDEGRLQAIGEEVAEFSARFPVP